MGLRVSGSMPLLFRFVFCDRITDAVPPNTEYPISGTSSVSVGRTVVSASLLEEMNSAMSSTSSLSSPSLLGLSDPILSSSSGSAVADAATSVFTDIEKGIGAADGVPIDVLDGGGL